MHSQANLLMYMYVCGWGASRIHVITFHIFPSIQQIIASDTERAAMVIVNITANASTLEVSSIIVATSIVEELTAAAIDQPEVRIQFTSSCMQDCFTIR